LARPLRTCEAVATATPLSILPITHVDWIGATQIAPAASCGQRLQSEMTASSDPRRRSDRRKYIRFPVWRLVIRGLPARIKIGPARVFTGVSA